MKNIDFYDVLDKELEEITNDFQEPLISRLKQSHQKKSHAFLIWFLNFYSGIKDQDEYITDGHDDNSCDIILDKTNSQNDKVFYLVQSKWNTRNNVDSRFESEVLKSYLSDASSILKGDIKHGSNKKFNQRYDQLYHI